MKIAYGIRTSCRCTRTELAMARQISPSSVTRTSNSRAELNVLGFYDAQGPQSITNKYTLWPHVHAMQSENAQSPGKNPAILSFHFSPS